MRKSSKTEDQIELCETALICDAFWSLDVLAVELQEGRSMQDRKQWGPFLEVYIDHLIRK